MKIEYGIVVQVDRVNQFLGALGWGGEADATRWSDPSQCQKSINSINAQRTAYNPYAGLVAMWQWVVPDTQATPTKPEAKPVCVCKRCKEQNEYAEANQPDGTYLCPSCRRYQKPW